MRKLVSVFILLMGIVISGIAQEPEDRGYIVNVGDMAPDFEMSLMDGQKVKLSDLKGKVVMLQFTASWCGVCRKEMPFIEKEIWQINKNKDFALYGLDRDEPIEKAQKLIDATGITYPIALDDGGKIFEQYALKNSGITRNVILNREGRIIYLTRLFNQEEFAAMKRVIEEELKN
ncbi:TlpA family protein disulfide reductase [Ancylomarina euxinus]|uniref:TlpA family protein disulfide reductase n=1 Tax=Ancylomarina euxinus TaxID=2283627 RepID=A0A425Y644_9BACT|nr:TlpA disulfide reductase family protein [Ancylomarina euxinus]MCZ4694147.1 TlpA disulfide reductase family protein [Ancylomarina euxinus]MUP15813.1 redoxin domain-containing protein [Ancylomarina euxinus]RRG23983.1 TlpA family protein disulfide reductase [Ancylomarina euxinus]